MFSWQVLPSQYGPVLPCYFLFCPSYWRTGDVPEISGRPAELLRRLRDLPAAARRLAGRGSGGGYAAVADEATQEVCGEPEPHAVAGGCDSDESGGDGGSHPIAVEMRNLRKVYGQQVAVRGLSLQMRLGEITSLLGHNGAGTGLPTDCLRLGLGQGARMGMVL